MKYEKVEKFRNKSDKERKAIIAALDILTKVSGEEMFFNHHENEAGNHDIEVHFKNPHLVNYFYMFYGAARQELNGDFSHYFKKITTDEKH